MEDPKVLERMRADWNERAGEDANYYVAFGRRDQEEDEFFATAADVVRVFEFELKRLPGRDAALEIGCGPGRLMRPLSRHFGEIHGVDVSDEMIRLARERLRGIPNAHPRHGTGSDLAPYPDGKFDLVYSFAVFQHIPSREVVFHYLREAWRVLKPGGILRCQINGLPAHARKYDTWSGVRISPDEVIAFTREQDFQLLALEQIWTQYMWITCRKRPEGWMPSLAQANPGLAAIRKIGNAYTGENVAPASGPLAALSLWIERLPPESDLIHMTIAADSRPCRIIFIGHPQDDAVSQVNVALPAGVRTGLIPVEARWLGQPMCEPVWVRLIPEVTAPRIHSISDGVTLLSANRIISGTVKLTIENLGHAEGFRATVDGMEVLDIDSFCADSINHRFEFNFRLPEAIPNGPQEVRISLGRRVLAPIAIEVAR